MNLVYYNTFPDYTKKGFDLENYVNTFLTSNVIINASYTNAFCPMHNTTFTIKSVFKGEEFYTTKNAKYKVTEKKFLIFNARQEHESYIDSEEKVDSLSLFLHPQYIQNFLSSTASSSETLLNSPIKIQSNFQQYQLIEKLYKKDKLTEYFLLNIKKSLSDFSENKNFIQEQIHLLLEHIFASQRNVMQEVHNLEPLRRATKIELYKRLNIVKDYIESCFNEKIKLSDLAKTACMSEHHMLREFKKLFKATPYQYLINTRLNESLLLLNQNKKSVSEISEAVGFEYLSSFSQAFRQKYKISPSQYQSTRSSKKSILSKP